MYVSLYAGECIQEVMKIKMHCFPTGDSFKNMNNLLTESKTSFWMNKFFKKSGDAQCLPKTSKVLNVYFQARRMALYALSNTQHIYLLKKSNKKKSILKFI